MAFIIATDGTPTDGANPWLDSLVAGGRFADADGGTTTITYAFCSGLDQASGRTGSLWSSNGIAAVSAALQAWQNVANIAFAAVGDPSYANIKYWNLSNYEMTIFRGPNVLGTHNLPLMRFNNVENGYFNNDPIAASWNSEGLTPGGKAFNTLLHEIGHGLGLAHPQDGAAPSFADGTRFPGVDAAFGDYGDFGLNQGIWTIMSYNAGWVSRPILSNSYGYCDLPPSEWPNFYFRNGHEGGMEWQGSTSRKISSASCVRRRSF